MRVLIIEDEAPAAKQLQKLIANIDPSIEVLDVVDSVSSAVKWLKELNHPDLIFMDIQLADGLSFDIFLQVELEVPVIFTTAYDEFALKAFKVNSVDYLLKPIDPDELRVAIQKFVDLHGKRQTYDVSAIDSLVKSLSKPKYRERFMVKSGQQLHYIQAADLLFAYADEGVVFLLTNDGSRHLIDQKVEDLNAVLDPQAFFRVNRKYLIHISLIKKIHTWFNNRLKLELCHGNDHEVIVSRERVADFKQWLDQ